MIHSPDATLPESLLTRWDTRYKIAGVTGLVVSFAFVQDIRLLPCMFFVTFLLVALSRLPLSLIGRRIRVPVLFMTFFVLLMLFAAGETVLLSLGPLAIRQEGLQWALVVSVRFICIVITVVILLNTSSLPSILTALRSLKVPPLMVDMAALFLRYLRVVGDDFRRMEQAARIRGFRGDRLRLSTLKTLGWLMGSLFLKSHDRSERIHKAMILRGYGRKTPYAGVVHGGAADRVLLGLFLLAAAALVIFESGIAGGAWRYFSQA